MAKRVVDETSLTAIADAIRAKAGTSDVMEFPNGFTEAIGAIQAGGDTSVEDGLLDGTVVSCSNDRVTAIAKSKFVDHVNLESVSFPNVTTIGQSAFSGCIKLKHASLPKLTTTGTGAFGSVAIEDIYYPSLQSPGQSCFSYCGSAKRAVLPSATDVTSNVFFGCYLLEYCDLPACELMGSNAIKNCYSLTALVLRTTKRLCTLSYSNYFSTCYHFLGTVDATYNPNGLKDGYIYVPRAFLSDTTSNKDYRRATNWTQYADRFRALEDWTVDGTTTGELDWDKINKVVINFTIDGTSYQADEGMTWAEWCDSSYNTNGYAVYGSAVLAPSGNSVMDASGYVVDKSAAIINSHAYTTYNHSGGGAN